MQEEINMLQKEFERIRDRGWIRETNRNKGSGGYTFENQLSKMEDDFPIPDYYNIEIKTMNNNTKTNLHLFNLTPDGDYLYPIPRILEELGCPSKNDRKLKTFYRSFNSKNYTKIVFGRRGKIVVNYDERKVDLVVINNRLENTNIGISWSFDYLKERLELKLKYLALVRVSSTIISGEGYYHYENITFYKLKDFDTFIHLINNGIIEITFKIGIHKTGSKYGKPYDHGTDFSIAVSNLELLYDKIM